MTPAEELDQILEELHENGVLGGIINDGRTHSLPSHSNSDPCVMKAKAKFHRLILKERREELQKVIDVVDSWPTSEAGHFLLLHLEERNRHLTTEIERSRG